MAERRLRYETENIEHITPLVDNEGVFRSDIKLSEFKNDLFYEYEGKTDISGYERDITGFISSIYEYEIDELPLALGQKWKIYYDARSESGSSLYDMGEHEVTIDGNGELCIDHTVYVTKTSIKLASSFNQAVKPMLIRLVCISGTYKETKIKQIDIKYIPNMLIVEIDSDVITDTTLGDKVKEAIQSGQSICIYREGEYIYPVYSRVVVDGDGDANTLELHGYSTIGTDNGAMPCKYTFSITSE